MREIHIYNVDGKTWDDFRSAVIKKRGKMHGVIGEELSLALMCALNHEEEFKNMKINKESGNK